MIGGLSFATFATLLVLPAMFSVVQRRGSTRSVSLYPFDPASRFFVSPATGQTGEPAVLANAPASGLPEHNLHGS